MSVESLIFTVNFEIEGDIQKIDVNKKIFLKGSTSQSTQQSWTSIIANMADVSHLNTEE